MSSFPAPSARGHYSRSPPGGVGSLIAENFADAAGTESCEWGSPPDGGGRAHSPGRPDACHRDIGTRDSIGWSSGLRLVTIRNSLPGGTTPLQWRTRFRVWPITAAGPRRILTGFPIKPTTKRLRRGPLSTSGKDRIGLPRENFQAAQSAPCRWQRRAELRPVSAR
jgi:hypothetical protein